MEDDVFSFFKNILFCSSTARLEVLGCPVAAALMDTSSVHWQEAHPNTNKNSKPEISFPNRFSQPRNTLSGYLFKYENKNNYYCIFKIISMFFFRLEDKWTKIHSISNVTASYFKPNIVLCRISPKRMPQFMDLLSWQVQQLWRETDTGSFKMVNNRIQLTEKSTYEKQHKAVTTVTSIYSKSPVIHIFKFTRN